MRVVALLQELLGMTSERMQVSRIMALLCQRLSVSWACLTALSADGEVFQHVGSAYLVDNKIGTCSFSSCHTNSGFGPNTPGGRGPPSRASSTNSIVGVSAVEVAMSDPHLLRGSDTSIEAAAFSKQPLMLSDPGTVVVAPSAAQPSSGWGAGLAAVQSAGQSIPASPFRQPSLHAAVSCSSAFGGRSDSQQQGSGQQPQWQQQQAELEPRPEGVLPVSAWPLDWQLMYREKGMRAFACLPVTATSGSGAIIGCLSFASSEPLDWSRQFWAGSTRLLTGWAAGAITTTRATARASFYARLYGATDLDGLARAFAYDMPIFLADGAAGPGTALPEVRLALVSSRLQHAVVFAAPLLQVSGRLGLPHLQQQGYAGAGAGGGGVGGAVVGASGVCGGAYGNGGYGGGVGGLQPINSGTSIAGLVLGSAIGSAADRFLPGQGGEVMPGGKPVPAAAAHGHAAHGGGVRPFSGTASGYDTMDCLVLGTAMDIDDQMSGQSSSNNSVGGGGGGGAGRRGHPSATDGGKGAMASHGAERGGPHGGLAVPEVPPVDCVKINTDSTLLMSVLEAGDIMIIKDALQYFGGGRMVARDLALNNTRPATGGTLVILPLVHRCRSLGCVYVFARNEFNLTFSRSAWGDLAGMLSRAVFGQLVGKLRHEWYAVLSEDPESQQALQFRSCRASAAGGGVGGRGRMRRTTTGNSLCSNASSLRPSFELPSRSMEQQGGAGGAGGAGPSREAAAAALAAAAEVLEYAGFILPDGEDGAGPMGAPAPLAPLPPFELAKSGEVAGAAPPPQLPVRHKIPPEHAALAAAGPERGSGGSGGTDGVDVTAGCSAVEEVAVEVAVAAGSAGQAGAGSVFDRRSPSPGSLSFKLPPNLGAGTSPVEQVLVSAGWGPAAAAANGKVGVSQQEQQQPRHERPGQAPSSAEGAQEQGQQPQQEGSQEQRKRQSQDEAPLDQGAGPSKESLATASVTGDAEVEAPAMAPAVCDVSAPTLTLTPLNVTVGMKEGVIHSDVRGGAVAGRPRPVSALQAAGSDGAVAVVPSPRVIAAAPVAVAAVAAAAAAADVDGDAEPEEVSGSSRELQGWPELVDILYDMHRTRNVSVYLAAYRGQAVAVKMMRSHTPMDGRPGHLESEALTIAAQQQLSTVRHPNVLHVLMVYPLVYEVVAGRVQRHGPTASGSSFVAHGGPNAPGPAPPNTGGVGAHPHPNLQQQPQQQLQQSGLGIGMLGPLHVQAHAMGDLIAGAGAMEASGGGVYLTAVLPRREKFKRGLALMLELFPSLSLREAIQKRMLLPLADSPGAGTVDGPMGPGGPYHPVSSQTIVSDVGCIAGPGSGGVGVGVGGNVSSGGMAAPPPPGAPHYQHTAHPQLPFLPSLPEALSAGNSNDAHGLGLFGANNNADSSPGLAITGASNSGGANTGGFCSGPTGGGVGGFGTNVPPSPALLLSILSQIAAGMAALHSAGLAHGELRPENILLAMPPGGGISATTSGQHDRTGPDCGSGTPPRVSPTPMPRGGGLAAAANAAAANAAGGITSGSGGAAGAGVGMAALTSGGSGRGRSGGGSWPPYQGGGGGPGSVSACDVDRLSKPERPQPGRPITPDAIVKVKDAGMTAVGFSKGSQMVRKLLQRNRNAVLPFLPPEVHRGERFGRSADVYMFGILMWELYTGCVAFSNLMGTPIKLLQTIIADGVRPPWPEGTPVWYQSLASRCWAGNPRQRPSFRRIGDKLAEAAAATSMAAGAAAAGWAAGGPLQGVAEGL